MENEDAEEEIYIYIYILEKWSGLFCEQFSTNQFKNDLYMSL